jgi:hypothetical protein
MLGPGVTTQQGGAPAVHAKLVQLFVQYLGLMDGGYNMI